MFNLMVMPASPALAVELAPNDAASRALLAAARTLAVEAAAVGISEAEIIGSRSSRWHTRHTGSLRAWGAPQVHTGAGSYLPEIMARYVLSTVPQITVRDSRDHLGTPAPKVLSIVVLDGSAGLTERAPLALIPGAQETHRWCEEMLMGASTSSDVEWLQQRGVEEPELWLELAACTPKCAQVKAADATLGVGRYVAGWEVSCAPSQ
ncbi:hypothetical protein [Corynebacterium sp. KPL2838]|uniref:hypothetical protein n=1 Tax=Corynebacterium sp. KPL2838 TaxID=3158316 RepID=UPI0032EFF995